MGDHLGRHFSKGECSERDEKYFFIHDFLEIPLSHKRKKKKKRRKKKFDVVEPKKVM